MTNTYYLFSALCFFCLLSPVACKHANFADDSEYEELGALACGVSPAVVNPKAPISISVSGIPKYSGRIQQVIQGPENANVNLVQKNGTIRREDGTPNTFTFEQEGNYQVTLKTLDYVNQLTSCSFKVVDSCPSGTSRVGVNVVFIVDNSKSHRLSDCPNGKMYGHGQTAVKKCQSETAREKAVSYSISILSEIGKTGGQASSFVAFAHFPRSHQVSVRWHNASAPTAISSIKNDMKVLRTPAGVTPYNEGLSSALQLLSQITDTSKQKVVVFVTDGYPTDRNPKHTLAVAQQLKQLNTKILSIMMTGKQSQTRLRNKHLENMRTAFIPSNWLQSYSGTQEQYFLELLGDGSLRYPGLLHNMSSEVIYIEDSSLLEQAIDGAVSTNALSCR
ncbi:MAG: VWA domain-containing protein [Proteobacteria bacterium]|nr:VWA domain-containing protein [Pseudomonadota bacterium]